MGETLQEAHMLISKASRILAVVFVLALMLFVGVPSARAELADLGPYSEYFHDTETGLYWFDPGTFYGDSRVGLDAMATYSGNWRWATSAEIDALVGCSSVAGSSLEDVMGSRLTTIGSGGPRWLGYYAEAAPDGWLAQSGDTPDFALMTATGSQGGAASLGAGAWMVSATNPATTTAVLEDYGTSGEYFHDLGTGYFWSDPAVFYGMSRAEVETWISTNAGWRWATAAEIYALLGKTSTDGTALDQILGARLTTIGSGGPRWVGFYDQATEPTGILIEASVDPQFYLLTSGGTQGGAAGLGAGAWVVNETGQAPAEVRTWGDVKSSFR